MKRKVWIPMTVIAAMLPIPVPLRYKDGGSVCFKAVLYDVTRFHQLDLDPRPDMTMDGGSGYWGSLYMMIGRNRIRRKRIWQSMRLRRAGSQRLMIPF